jgi:cytochrome c553
MRHGKTALIGLAACAGVWMAASLAAHGADAPQVSAPLWAYPLNPPPPPGAPQTAPDPAPYTVPGSKLMFTRAQQNLFNPPDWHPEDHPVMPEVVAHGRKPDVYACSYCHLPSGQGRSENATLAGLPEAYFVQQMADFKSGARKSTVDHRAPGDNMLVVAKAISDEESAIAAAYFAKIRSKPYIKVIQTSTAPRTVDKSWVLALHPEGGKEPIGNRIIETAADFELFERRDGRTQWLVYAPPGSVAKGKALALGRNGRAEVACVACHGQDLRGLGDIPGLAGRSPSYVARQLTDFRTGARAGPGAPPMKAVADALSATDIVNLTAYMASLK